MGNVMSRILIASAAGAAVQTLPSLAIRRPFRRHLPALSGKGRPGTVALTFDDGPDPRLTPHILTALGDLSWPATFFALGERAREHPGLVRQVLNGGHEVGLHGHTHRRLVRLGPVATMREFREGVDAIKAASGIAPRWYRPPYGALSGVALGACLALNLRPVLWTSESGDWEPESDASAIRKNVVDSIGSGGTVLFHDAVQSRAPINNVIEALSLLAEDFSAARLRVVPLQEHLLL